MGNHVFLHFFFFKQSDRQSIYLLSHNGLYNARPKEGAENLLQGTDTTTWGIICKHLQGHALTEAGVKSQGWDLNPGTSMWAIVILTSFLIGRANTFIFLFYWYNDLLTALDKGTQKGKIEYKTPTPHSP